MNNRTRTSGPGWLGVFIAALLFVPAPIVDASMGSAREDLERMLWAERQSFTAIEVTTDYPATRPEVINRFDLVVWNGLVVQRLIESTSEIVGEGSRGSDSPTGPEDVDSMAIPTFPDGLGNLDRLFRNYDVEAVGTKGVGDDAVVGYRITPRSRQGHTIELVLSAKGPFVKVQIFGANGKIFSRERHNLVFNPTLSQDTIDRVQKKGRPNIGDTAGHGGQRISAGEARRRLPGLLVPTAPILGFELDAIELVTDGRTGQNIIFETLDDGLQRLVLVQTPASENQTDPDSRGSKIVQPVTGENPETWIIWRLERSEGLEVFEWTMANQIACLFVSPLNREQSQEAVRILAGLRTG